MRRFCFIVVSIMQALLVSSAYCQDAELKEVQENLLESLKETAACFGSTLQYPSQYFSNKTWISKDFSTGYIPTQGFKKIDDFRFEYDYESGVLASKALDQASGTLLRPALIDCTVAIQIHYYNAILNFLGDKRFDAVVSKAAQHGYFLFLGMPLGKPNLLTLFFEEHPYDVDKHDDGDLCYIGANSIFHQMYGIGFGNGYNTFCANRDQGQFTSLGFTNSTVPEIQDRILEDLKSGPDPLYLTPEESQKKKAEFEETNGVPQHNQISGITDVHRPAYSNLLRISEAQSKEDFEQVMSEIVKTYREDT